MRRKRFGLLEKLDTLSPTMRTKLEREQERLRVGIESDLEKIKVIKQLLRKRSA